MRLGLTGRITKIFNQVFVGGVGDTAWRDHSSTVIKDMTSGLDVSARTVFIISQSHSLEVCVKPAGSRAQAVKLDPCIARHLAFWWGVSETRDKWLKRIWYWRGEKSWLVRFSMSGLKGRLERSLLGARRTCRVSCSRLSGLCDLRCTVALDMPHIVEYWGTGFQKRKKVYRG